jgi:hypothetical protein
MDDSTSQTFATVDRMLVLGERWYEHSHYLGLFDGCLFAKTRAAARKG